MENLRHKFGYEAMVEKNTICDRLRAEGVTDHMELYFRTQREYEANHANDPTYRERNKAFLARADASESRTFTDEELAYMAEIFAGSNHPIAQSIAAKASEGGE